MKIISELLPVETLGFGLYFAPIKASSKYQNGQWGPVEFSSNLDITLGTGAKVFHYAQEIFEGMKAYKQADGSLALFRPHSNIARMKKSAAMMAMQAFPEDVFLATVKEVVKRVPHLVPDRPGALYLRPFTIGITDSLGVAAAEEYAFTIIASPVGGYFKEISADKPVAVKVKATDKYVRAAPGGTGAAKTGGNYAASLRAILEAKHEGYSNVLFLDGREHRYIEELGGMNFFAVDNGVLKTPLLGDTVLAGVTRDSILRLSKTLDIPCSEENLDINDLIQKIKSGTVTETFACGTAATISAISHLVWKGEDVAISGGKVGPITMRLYKTLGDIFYGNIPPPEKNWIVPV